MVLFKTYNSLFFSTPWVRHNTLYMIKHVEVVTHCKGLVRLMTAKKYADLLTFLGILQTARRRLTIKYKNHVRRAMRK